jgi:hypothetical protein
MKVTLAQAGIVAGILTLAWSVGGPKEVYSAHSAPVGNYPHYVFNSTSKAHAEKVASLVPDSIVGSRGPRGKETWIVKSKMPAHEARSYFTPWLKENNYFRTNQFLSEVKYEAESFAAEGEHSWWSANDYLDGKWYICSNCGAEKAGGRKRKPNKAGCEGRKKSAESFSAEEFDRSNISVPKDWEPKKYPYEKRVTSETKTKWCENCGELDDSDEDAWNHYQFVLKQKNSTKPVMRFISGGACEGCGVDLCENCIDGKTSGNFNPLFEPICDDCGYPFCKECKDEDRCDNCEEEHESNRCDCCGHVHHAESFSAEDEDTTTCEDCGVKIGYDEAIDWEGLDRCEDCYDYWMMKDRQNYTGDETDCISCGYSISPNDVRFELVEGLCPDCKDTESFSAEENEMCPSCERAKISQDHDRYLVCPLCEWRSDEPLPCRHLNIEITDTDYDGEYEGGVMVYARCEDCYADGQAFGVWEFDDDYNAEGKSFSAEECSTEGCENEAGYWDKAKTKPIPRGICMRCFIRPSLSNPTNKMMKRQSGVFSAEDVTEDLAEVRTDLSQKRTNMSALRTALSVAGLFLVWDSWRWSKEERKLKGL